MRSAYNKALGYIAKQDHTERQVRSYLARAKEEYDEAEIAAAIEKLKDKKFIDDAKYARTAMAGKIKRKQYSTAYARQYLYAEDVDGELVEEIIAGLGAEYEYEAAAAFIAREMKKTYSGKSRAEKLQKIMQKAARRGYHYAAISSAANGLEEEE